MENWKREQFLCDLQQACLAVFSSAMWRHDVIHHDGGTVFLEVVFNVYHN